MSTNIKAKFALYCKLNPWLIFLTSSLEIATYLIFIAIYIWVTFVWKYDDHCPQGYQGPGGLHHNKAYFNCTGGAANYLDRIIFGKNHLYLEVSSKELYLNTIPHDPEGLLGTTTSIFLTGIGVLAGYILTNFKSSKSKIFLWITMIIILGK